MQRRHTQWLVPKMHLVQCCFFFCYEYQYMYICILIHFVLMIFCRLQTLFGKEADRLEHSNDDERTCIL